MVSSTGFIESPQDERDLILGCPNSFKLPEYCDYSDMITQVKNQGSTMKCVPYSLSYSLELQNGLNGVDIEVDINEIYNSRSNNGEGMAIRDALKYVKHVGYEGRKIESYWRLKDISSIKYNLLINGPCLMALPVYSNNSDFWNGDNYQGGHAICCVGYDKYGFTLLNTWGYGFGNDGKCFLPYDEYDKIIECWGILV